MRVIVIVDYAHTKGGAERVAWLNARGLAEQGHQVTVLCAVGPVEPELLQCANLDVVCLNQSDLLKNTSKLQAAWQGVWNKAAALAMRQILASCDVAQTIVHVHSWTHALSSAPLYAAVRAGAKVIITLHDYFVSCPNGGFYDFQAGEACQRVPLSLSCLCTNCDARSGWHKMYRVARQYTQRYLAKIPSSVRHFITISDLNRQLNLPYLPEQKQLYHVNNPFEIPQTDPVNVAQQKRIIFVGRLVPEKAPQHLAMATAALGLPVTFVGDGPLAETIRKINPAAEITGWATSDEVTRHMRQARALVLPSVWYEGQPLVTLEAAAHGVPSIVSDKCAGREQIVPGVTGYLFSGGDPVDLQRALQQLENDEHVGQLGQAAWQKFWSGGFTLDEHLHKLLTIYAQMLDQDKYESAEPKLVASVV